MNTQVVIGFCCALALSGCGQYGSLYLPEKPAARPQPQQPASGAPAAGKPADSTTDQSEEP